MYYLCEHLSSCYWTEGITYWMLLELEFQPYISPNAEIHSCKKKIQTFFLIKKSVCINVRKSHSYFENVFLRKAFKTGKDTQLMYLV